MAQIKGAYSGGIHRLDQGQNLVGAGGAGGALGANFLNPDPEKAVGIDIADDEFSDYPFLLADSGEIELPLKMRAQATTGRQGRQASRLARGRGVIIAVSRRKPGIRLIAGVFIDVVVPVDFTQG